MTNLLPCPFCRQPAKLETDSDHHGKYFSLGCGTNSCPCHHAYYMMPIEELDSAVETWNRRAYSHRNGETEAPTWEPQP